MWGRGWAVGVVEKTQVCLLSLLQYFPSLLWCISASSALCEAFLDTLLDGELAKEGSGEKKKLPSHWTGGWGEGQKNPAH